MRRAGLTACDGYTRSVIRFIRVSQVAEEGSHRAGSAWRMVRSQPSWIHRWVATLFLLVLALPIVLLALLALFGAALLFIVLVIANTILRAVRSIMPRRDGRKNVKVIERR